MIADIRTAIAAVLTAGFNSAGWNVSAYLTDKPEPPQMDVKTGPINYDLAMMGGNWDLSFQVRALVQWGDFGAAQQMLDPLLEQSGSSFKEVLEADRTLGGTCSSLRVVGVSEPTIFLGNPDLFGVDFTVEVTPNG